jgi:hypothetical protein
MGDQNVGAGIFTVKHTFTREELRELGLRLAGKAQEVYNAKSAKKAAAAAAAGHIQELEDDVAGLVQKLNQLWEPREMECQIYYHTPKHGYKTIIRPDTGETIREPEPMSEAEMQSSFVFVDTPPESKDKPQ